MQVKDQQQLANWLASKASLREVEEAPRIGIVGNERFTEQARRAFIWLWMWGAPRFSGLAGEAQERVYKRHGYAALERRYARVGRITARLTGGAA